MKHISYIILCWGFVLISACESLVEVKYPSNQLGSPQVFEDVQTANAALAGIYAELQRRSVVEGASIYGPLLLGAYTDELQSHHFDQSILDIYTNELLETNSILKTCWNISYTQIYYANSIIIGAERSTVLSDQDKAFIKGEALLVRSLIYFYLQQMFGDIPYTTSLDYEYNRNLSKTEAQAVLAQLENDLKETVTLLKDDYRNSERIYPNRKAAQLLLARIYVAGHKYKEAEQVAKEILLSTQYEFEDDINEVFHKTGKHILWQLKPENDGDGTSEAKYYYFTDVAPSNIFTLNLDLVNCFADNDLRKQLWIAEVTVNGNSWFRPYKYKNRSNNTTEYSVIFRLEEVYFIMAEALAKQNRIDEALAYLNKTRERAGLVALGSLSEEDFIDELLTEKRREFFTEQGHRFLDLKRLGRLDDLSDVKPNWKEYMSVFPLPLDELLMNPNLYPQNQGY